MLFCSEIGELNNEYIGYDLFKGSFSVQMHQNQSINYY